MSYADHVWGNNWESCADNEGFIDYKKLCEVYHKEFEKFEMDMKSKLTAADQLIAEKDKRIKELEGVVTRQASTMSDWVNKTKLLEAKLAKAVEQRNYQIQRAYKRSTSWQQEQGVQISEANKVLDSITLETLGDK